MTKSDEDWRWVYRQNLCVADGAPLRLKIFTTHFLQIGNCCGEEIRIDTCLLTVEINYQESRTKIERISK